MANEVIDNPAQHPKYEPVQLTARRTRQNECGYGRGKGDNDQGQSQYEHKEPDQAL